MTQWGDLESETQLTFAFEDSLYGSNSAAALQVTL